MHTAPRGYGSDPAESLAVGRLRFLAFSLGGLSGKKLLAGGLANEKMTVSHLRRRNGLNSRREWSTATRTFGLSGERGIRRDEFKNEFKPSLKDARGRFGTLGDRTQAVDPEASRNVRKRHHTLPRWMSRVRPPFPAPTQEHVRTRVLVSSGPKPEGPEIAQEFTRESSRESSRLTALVQSKTATNRRGSIAFLRMHLRAEKPKSGAYPRELKT